MSVLNSPRQPPRVAARDPHAVDLAWALGRARDWLLGPTPLVTNLALFVFATLGTVLWQISQHPDRLSLPGWVTVWGVLVAIHAAGVVAYGTLRAARSPRPGPVYYHAIPVEQRTAGRSAATSRTAAPAEPAAMARPSWEGALAPVTPFPTVRGGERSGTGLPAAPDQDDVTAVHHDAASAGPDGPSSRASALADVREVLASDQPLWRRWRRRTSASEDLTPLPADATDSWLSPFPGAPPVTRPAPAAPLFPEHSETSRWTGPADRAQVATVGQHWPAPQPARSAPTGETPRPAEGEQLPSLAAMLRSNNLTRLSDAPIRGSQTGAPSEPAPTPAPMPAPPTPLPRPSAMDAPRPKTVALFAAFGIGDDGNPAQPAGDDAETEPGSAAPSDRPRVRRPPDAR